MFATTCASCHGLDGHGGERAPDIASRREIQKLSDPALSRIIREGVSGKGMPSFRSLGDSKIQAVVRHLRALQGRDSAASSPGSPENGKDLFFAKAACAECHMVHGTGGFMGSDLSSYGRTRSVEQIREAITSPDKNLDGRGRTVVATTREGQTFAGIARNEDNFSLQLQTRDGVFHSFEKSDLRSIERPTESLMPSDYGSRLSRQELDDIVSYLIAVSGKTGSEKKSSTPRAAGRRINL